MKKSPVEIGMAYENSVVEMLQSCDLEAYRTNKANPSDPKQYKAGFDGGVDVIAKYSVKGNVCKNFVFYIQCKHHKENLTKSAISQAYAGMHVRGEFSKGGIPVVFSTADATEETRTFAKTLGVELILKREIALIGHARTTGQIVYADYGVLMKILLHHYTKDSDLLETLPDTNSDSATISLKEQLYWQTKMDIAMLQSELDTIASLELKLQQKKQKMIDKIKIAMFRNVQTIDYSRNSHEKQIKSDSQTTDMESG